MSARPRSCPDVPPAALRTGIEQFNRGEYFECHETLEALWLAEPTSLRRLYQGILQVGVALHHLGPATTAAPTVCSPAARGLSSRSRRAAWASTWRGSWRRRGAARRR